MEFGFRILDEKQYYNTNIYDRKYESAMFIVKQSQTM